MSTTGYRNWGVLFICTLKPCHVSRTILMHVQFPHVTQQLSSQSKLTLNLEIILRGLSTRSSLRALSMLMWLLGAAAETMEVMTTTASS